MTAQVLSFLPDFLLAFLTNLWVAAASLSVGLTLGVPLAFSRQSQTPVLVWAAEMLTALLRAAPTFVVMFFLLNILPHEIGLGAGVLRVSPEAVLIAALGIYAAGYVSDSGGDALAHARAGSTEGALLIVPGLVRVFFVLTMASSTGAAIGVHEAVTAALHVVDTLPDRGARILVVLAVILFFTAVLQTANLGVRALTRAIQRSLARTAENADDLPGGVLHFHRTLLLIRPLLWAIPVALAVVAGLALLAPLPPRAITIETGPEGGTWHQAALRFQTALLRDGIAVHVKPNDASLTIVNDVNNPGSRVDVAFTVQAVDKKRLPRVTTLGSMDYQPMFVVYRAALGTLTSPAALRGLRLVLPPRDSATAAIALPLLRSYGVTADNTPIVFAPLASLTLELMADRFDAGILIVSAGTPAIRQLAARPGLRIMDFAQATAIDRLVPALHETVLPRGSLDLRNDIPAGDIRLIAIATDVVVREDLHPAIVYLLLRAMVEDYAGGDVTTREGEFPAPRDRLLRINPNAATFYKSGLPWEYRVAPLWLASIVSFYLVLIVPVAVLVPVYNWLELPGADQIYRRIRLYYWVRLLRAIERRLDQGAPLDDIHRQALAAIRAELAPPDVEGGATAILLRIDGKSPSGDVTTA